MTLSGTIKKKIIDRGFGFILCSDGHEYFFHRTDLRGLTFDQITQGAAVCFELQASTRKRGQQDAVNVRPANAPLVPVARLQRVARGNPHAPAGSYPPYRFIPINLDHAATDAPVWHDGSGGGELLSGELLCTLEALTPLLPGNDRYKVSEVDRGQLIAWGLPNLLDNKQQIAEPLRLDGRVVIPGSALKGMVRHSLGALLSAPMERVGERHYTYRPNLQVQDNGLQRIVTRPAVYADPANGKPRVWVLDEVRAGIFVRDRAIAAIQTATSSQGLLQKGTVIAGVNRQAGPVGSRILPGGSWTTDQEYSVLDYRGGIDGQGKLGARFDPPTTTYSLALVPQALLDSAVELGIDDQIFQAYLDTQKVLANGDTGHLFSHPLLEKKDVDDIARTISASTSLAPWQLIYVEVSLDRGMVTTNSRILSLGHHFRYRWAYTSSIRKKGGKLRGCLSPLKDETQDRPTRLSGARLLFGYVHSQEGPIGAGAYKRLAGRIAINHAVSDGVPEFLGEENTGWCISLPILGNPKPSAWEFYLQQAPGRRLPVTYGDLPGDDGGDLAGRKFYLHQPKIQAAKDLGSGTVGEEQATLARFICKPTTTFRFTLRFARLRLWELGALLAVLEPQRLAKDDAKYAHKLGLGRPLGMGSVRIGIDKIRVRSESKTQLAEQSGLDEKAVACLREQLREKLDQASLERWLEIHRFSDRGRFDYPLKTETRRDGTQETTIFNWHTDIRKGYSKLRREKEPDADALLKQILKGHDLPPKGEK